MKQNKKDGRRKVKKIGIYGRKAREKEKMEEEEEMREGENQR